MSDYSFLSNFRFVLKVDGAFDVPLKSVRAFNRENEYDYIQEGGLNDYVHMRRKPISKPYTLVVERYVPASLGINDPLTSGVELLLPLLLFVGKNTGGSTMNYSRYYAFTGAVVMSKEYGGLDAERAGMLTESITIGYNQMFCITNPVEGTDYPAWEFSVNGSGNIKRKHSVKGTEPEQNSKKWYKIKNNVHEIDEDKKVLWKFKEDSKAGQGKASHAMLPDVTESSRADFEKNRKLFNFAYENNRAKYTGTYKKSEKSAQNAAFSDKTLGENIGIKEMTRAEMEALAREFKLTEDKKKTGNGVISSKQHRAALESTKKAMMENASLWEFDEKNKAGKGESARAVSGAAKNEKTREEMEKAAVKREFGGIDEPVKDEFAGSSRKWEFDEKTKEGAGERNRQNAYADDAAEGGVSGQGILEPGAEEMAAAANKWEFGQDKYSTDGNDVKSAAVIPGIEEPAPADLKEKAKRWQFDEKSKGGKGPRSRQNAEVSGSGEDAKATGLGVQELSKEELEAARKKWEFSDPYSKEGSGVKSRRDPAGKEISKKTMARMAEKWEFGEGSGDIAGNGRKSSTKRDETRRGAHEEKKRHWEFNKKSKAGAGDTSRQIREDIIEYDRETLEKSTRRFNLDKDGTKAGTGTSSRNMTAVKEGTKSDHQKKVRTWKMDKSGTKAGTGVANRKTMEGYTETDRETMEKAATHHVFATHPGGGKPAEHRRFDLDKQKTKEGTGTPSRTPPKPPEASKSGLAGKSKKWKMDGNKSKAGQGPSSRNTTGNIKELSKADMAKRAVKHKKANIADFLRR